MVLIDNKTVKLTDFGIAHLNNSFGTTTKESNRVVGTPEYMALEQIMGRATTDKKSISGY